MVENIDATIIARCRSSPAADGGEYRRGPAIYLEPGRSAKATTERISFTGAARALRHKLRTIFIEEVADCWAIIE